MNAGQKAFCMILFLMAFLFIGPYIPQFVLRILAP